MLQLLYAEPVQSDFLKYFNEINFTQIHCLKQFNFVQREEYYFTFVCS